jgi:mono/diheme cytochrome c family protein
MRNEMMQSPKVWLFLCAAMLGFTAPAVFAAADDGAKIVADVCSTCHTAKTRPLDKMHFTRAEYAEAVERMLGYGAEVPKDKMPALLDYLVQNHGPVPADGDAGKK